MIGALAIRSLLVLLAAVAPALVAADVRGVRPAVAESSDESLLVDAIDDIRRARLDQALGTLERLLERNPDFRLAQLVYADALLAKTRPLERFGGQHREALAIEELRSEATARLRSHSWTPPVAAVPEYLLELSASHPRALVVDVAAARLYVLVQGSDGIGLAGDYYVSIGKRGYGKKLEGDQKTPIGVYFTTGRISSSELPDFYGSGALPIDYPNERDVRLGRTGYGIWIHGVPGDTYSRAPRASDGCVVLANEDLDAVLAIAGEEGTPVVIADGVEWRKPAELAARRQDLMRALDDWQRDWQSSDAERRTRQYSARLPRETSVHDALLGEGQAGADEVSAIGLSDISLFAYPGQADLFVANFVVDDPAHALGRDSRRRQYWEHGPNGEWRIVYDGPIEPRPEHFRGIPYSARGSGSDLKP